MLVGRSGLSPVMIGRTAQLGRLLGLFERSGPAVALIGGEAGVGKSRLVRELLDRLPARTPVLAGQADPGALGRPFELLLDALGDQLDPDDPELAELREPAEDLSAPQRARNAVDLVRRVLADRPSVVVFDDLHWADSESVALFEALADPSPTPVLLVGTFRPDELHRRHPMAELVPRLERRHDVVQLRLERLAVGEVAAFLDAVYGRPVSYRVAEALHTRTGGNPFFLEELLVAAGDVDPEELTSLPLPWSLGEVVRRQVDDLDPGARRIVETAAVLGHRVPFDLLATVTQTSEGELIDVLRELVVQGLLVESEPDVFGFRHALAREAIETRLLGRERRRLHQAALAALREAHSGDLAAIARHAHGAGRYEELVSASRDAARHYLSIGSSYQALGMAELGLSEADDDLELRSLAAEAAWLAGLREEATAHAVVLRDKAHNQGDLACVSVALRRLIRLWWEGDDAPRRSEAVVELRTLLDQLDGTPDQARAFAVLAQEAMLDGRSEEALSWADRALASAEEQGLLDVRAAALVERGSALVSMPGRAAEGVALLLSVLDQAERIGEDVLTARAAYNLARSESPALEHDMVINLLDRMREAAERAGFDVMMDLEYCEGRAALAAREGDLAEAVRWVDRARPERTSTRLARGRRWYDLSRTHMLIEAERLDEAIEALDAVVVVGPDETWARALRVEIAALRRDPSAVRAALRYMVDSLAPEGCDIRTLTTFLGAVLDLGISAVELRPIIDAAVLWEGQRHPSAAPWFSLRDGYIALAEGRPDDALRAFMSAAEPPPEGVLPLAAPDAGAAHVGAARAAIALQRIDLAKRHAAEAEAALASWGGWKRQQLDSVLRRLGRADGPVGPPSLTAREREVIALLAEGLTNAELADRLFISPKTAAVHVSNILSKLGLASRAEAAAWAVREGLSA